MKILTIIGTITADEDAAVRELVALVRAGARYPDDLLDRLPRGRVEVHVASDSDDQQLAVITIEGPMFRFQPLTVQ